MVVPYSSVLEAELAERCKELGREPGQWVRRFQLRL
jgi:hypothetical protein